MTSSPPLKTGVTPPVAATMSLCCGWVKIGWQKPGVMHNGACRDRHGGKLGETYYLTDSGLVMDDDGTMRKRAA